MGVGVRERSSQTASLGWPDHAAMNQLVCMVSGQRMHTR
jgi:hypothetical protein